MAFISFTSFARMYAVGDAEPEALGVVGGKRCRRAHVEYRGGFEEVSRLVRAFLRVAALFENARRISEHLHLLL